MFKYFLLFLAFASIASIVSAQGPICTEDQGKYKGVCISKTCINSLNTAVWSLVTPKPASFAGSPGKIFFTAYKQGGPDNISYVQEIDFTDSASSLFAAINNCLSYKVYQVTSDTDITRRTFTNADGSSWPAVQSQYSASNGGYGQILFRVTQEDLDTKQCVKAVLPGFGDIVWKCYFELSINVQSTTQVSYFFGFQVRVNARFPLATGGLMNVTPAQVKSNCVDGDMTCTLNVAVNNGLKFCTTSACTTLATGLQTISIGQSIFMIHYIADGTFDGRAPPVGSAGFIIAANNNPQGYQINSPIVRLAGEFEVAFKEGDAGFKVLVKKTGYSIYELNSLLASSGITIYAEGVLGQAIKNNRNLVEEQPKEYTVTTSAEFGEIIDPSKPSPVMPPVIGSPSSSSSSSSSSPVVSNISSSSSDVRDNLITSSSYWLQAGCVLALCNLLQ